MSRMSDIDCDREARPFITMTVKWATPLIYRQYASLNMVSIKTEGLVGTGWAEYDELLIAIKRLNVRCYNANSSEDV